MTSRHADETVDGSTHASSVMPIVNCNEAELGTFTRALDPLKLNAPPNLPELDHVVFDTVPTLPVPDESPVAVPAPSSNEYAATSELVAALWVVAVMTFENAPWLPDA